MQIQQIIACDLSRNCVWKMITCAKFFPYMVPYISIHKQAGIHKHTTQQHFSFSRFIRSKDDWSWCAFHHTEGIAVFHLVFHLVLLTWPKFCVWIDLDNKQTPRFPKRWICRTLLLEQFYGWRILVRVWRNPSLGGGGDGGGGSCLPSRYLFSVFITPCIVQ